MIAPDIKEALVNLASSLEILSGNMDRLAGTLRKQVKTLSWVIKKLSENPKKACSVIHNLITLYYNLFRKRIFHVGCSKCRPDAAGSGYQ